MRENPDIRIIKQHKKGIQKNHVPAEQESGAFLLEEKVIIPNTADSRQHLLRQSR